MTPKLHIIIPCYNEEQVLPITSKMFLEKLRFLIDSGRVSEDSQILFVDDGSKDQTWKIICDLSKQDSHYMGIRQSRNRGHQNAVLAGLLESKDRCDITISIDCDGQDDINAMMPWWMPIWMAVISFTVFAAAGRRIPALNVLPRRAFISF